jgi:tRNA (mo5U34)-methyltransferase
MHHQVGDVVADLSPLVARMASARSAVAESVAWYPYDILGSLIHIDRLLPEPYRDLDALVRGLPVADIGAADGDLAFTLEHVAGWTIDIVDCAGSNNNGLRAARLLKAHLGSAANIHDIDLDEQFWLPRDRYGLIFLLGTLYHLQNPLYALHRIATQARYCIMSTRVARWAGPGPTEIDQLPVAYLVGPTELNNDPTNYWVFSNAGLRRAVERSGWIIRASMNVGDTSTSNPHSNAHDERVFMLLESRIPESASRPATNMLSTVRHAIRPSRLRRALADRLSRT